MRSKVAIAPPTLQPPPDRTPDPHDSAFPPVPVRVLTIARTWIAVAGVFLLIDMWRHMLVGLTDGNGRPIGDDFINYWSGGALALAGRAAEAYRYAPYHAFQETIVGAAVSPMYLYSYPPVMMVLMMPLALTPYVPAFGIWLVGTWAMFWRALRLAMPNGGALLLALAAPAVFVNAISGQNGAFTAALLGGGLCLLDRRPAIAGVLFGLLVYKPHLGILLPIALIAGRQWRALFAAGATVAVLAAASAALFGPSIFADYLRVAGVLRFVILETGEGIWSRMVSVFVFGRLLGLDVAASYAVQAGSALIAAAVVAFAWFTGRTAPVRYAALVLGTLMATPYLQDYDLVVAVFAVVWLWQMDGIEQRLRLAACAALLLLPALAGAIAQATGFSLGPLFILPAFVIVARSVWREHSASGAAAASLPS